MQKQEAYHATKRDNITDILTEGFKTSISTNKKEHWLGKGIYFYEDLYYAVEWCYLGLKNQNKNLEILKEKFGIIKVEIDTDNFKILDLNSGIGYDTFRKIVHTIKDKCSKEELKKIENDGDIKIIRIIEKVEEELGKKIFSAFDVIYALYPKNIFKKSTNHQGDFFVGMQKQICVKNPKAITSKKEYNVENENIVNIYNLIVENRRKIK